MPTIDKILPWAGLSKAKVFSILDAKDGFWQIKLDNLKKVVCSQRFGHRLEDTDGFVCHLVSTQPQKSFRGDNTKC